MPEPGSERPACHTFGTNRATAVMHPILSRRGLLGPYLAAWSFLGALLAAVSGAGPGEWLAAAALALPLALAYGFLCLAVWYPCRATPLAGSGALRVAVTHGAAAAFASGLWLALGTGVAALFARLPLLAKSAEVFRQERALYFATGVLLYLLAAAFCYLLIAGERSRRAEAQALELEVTAREAELSALKAQIDPHFLFNSLNAVASLAGSDPLAAREMALSLAGFLRSSRAAASRVALTLTEELDLAASYLAIEKVRFGDRLKVVQRVDEAARTWTVPPLVLQPVVENAVRHGIAHLVTGGEVRIEAALVADRLRLTVENPFDPSSRGKSRGSGTGLTNVRRRLRLIYGGQAGLTTQRDDERFTVEIDLPRALAPEPG